MNQQPTATEQDAISAARASRARCACGEDHDDCDPVTPAMIARMKGYVAANPAHQFAIDDEAGIAAVIIARDPDPPEIVAHADTLANLLDAIGAPSAEALS